MHEESHRIPRSREHALRTQRLAPALLLLACLLAACADDSEGRTISRPQALTNVRETPRFRVHSDLAAEELDFQVRWFDAFWTWFEERWFAVPPGRPLWIWLFGDPATFESWNASMGRESTSGFYAAGDNGQGVLVVDLQTGLGTATHELVHHFVHQAFGERAPHWFNEGFAAFFEKFLARLGDDGRLELSVGYFSNWRFPIAKRDVDGYSLAGLFAAGPDVDQCAARSLILFLHRQGKLRAFVQAMLARTGDPDGSQTLQQVFGTPLPTLERAWLEWIRAQPIDADVDLVPQSLLHTPAEHDRWLQRHEARLRYDDALERYVPR